MTNSIPPFTIPPSDIGSSEIMSDENLMSEKIKKNSFESRKTIPQGVGVDSCPTPLPACELENDFPENNSGSTKEEIRGLMKRSLRFLCGQFLGYGDWGRVHDDVEALLRRGSRRKALLLPRNHLKSSIVTIGYSIQAILINPNVRILIANQVWDMARKFLDEIKWHLERSKIRHFFGDFVSARWNADEIIVMQREKGYKEPTIRTAGVEAEQTSGHYDIIILDDLMGLQNSQTGDQRDKAKRFRRSMMNLLEPGGLLVDVGTRWSYDDTFSEVLEKERKYTDVMVRRVVEDGHLLLPTKFAKKFDEEKKSWISVNDDTCLDYIEYLRSMMPPDEFSCQYENNPMSRELQLFKPELFKYWNQKPERLHTVMTVDLAISQGESADETAIVVCGMDEKWNLFVLDYLNGKWNPTRIVENVFEMRNRWKPNIVGMETNGFQRMLKLACEDEMRKRKEYFPIDEIRTGPERSKEQRIKSLEPFYRNGSVYHAAWMKGKELEKQLEEFPRGKLIDVADSLSMTLPFLNPGIGRQAQQIQEYSWDWWMNKAQEHNTFYKGFFDYGR